LLGITQKPVIAIFGVAAMLMGNKYINCFELLYYMTLYQQMRIAHRSGVQHDTIDTEVMEILSNRLLKEKNVTWDKVTRRAAWEEIHKQVSEKWGYIPKPCGFFETLAYKIGYYLF